MVGGDSGKALKKKLDGTINWRQGSLVGVQNGGGGCGPEQRDSGALYDFQATSSWFASAGAMLGSYGNCY